MRTAPSYLLAILLIASCSCSVVRPWNQTVEFTSEPSGMPLIVDGKTYRTPANVKLRRDDTHTYRIEKKGYQTASGVIDSNLNITGYLDIAGTVVAFPVSLGFPWVVGILVPGSRSLDSESVHIIMTRD